MNSIRERLVRDLVARLSVAVSPTPVVRHPTTPINREASPALLLFVESDAIANRANDRVDRTLTLRLVMVARGDDAFDQADRAMVAAHAALMNSANLDGLAIALREIDCEWEAEDADAGAVVLPARYEIRYRTRFDDLTQPG